MSKGKKIEMVSIYNKGRRVWPFLVDGKPKNCNPKTSIELDKPTADKMVKGYPLELMHSTDLVKGSGVADVAKIKKQVEDLTTENVDLKKQVEDLTKTIEELTKPKDEKEGK